MFSPRISDNVSLTNETNDLTDLLNSSTSIVHNTSVGDYSRILNQSRVLYEKCKSRDLYEKCKRDLLMHN